MIKVINSYKKEVRFSFIIFICIICGLLIGLQIGLMYGWQSQNAVWEGVCKGGALVEGPDKVVMTVHCPSHDQFKTSSIPVMLASKNEGRVFFCRKTEGNIMKDENWRCTVPEKGTD